MQHHYERDQDRPVLQGSAKRWTLGCVNPASWLSLAAGDEFTQPTAHSFAQPCMCNTPFIACAVFRVWQGDLSATKFPRSDQITRAQKKLITTTACRRNQHRLTDEGIKDNLLLLLLPSFHHYTDPFDGDFHAVGSRGRTRAVDL